MKVQGNVSRVDLSSVQRTQGVPQDSRDLVVGRNVKEDINQQEKKQKPGTEMIEGALDKINNTVRIFNRSIHFSKHEESGRLWVRVIDTETKKVVREIPPEEILEIVARLEEMVGLLVDERR